MSPYTDPVDRDKDGTISRLEREDLDGDGRITIFDLTLMAQNFLKVLPEAPKPVGGVEQAIATRGDRRLPHQINLPPPLPTWAWGIHGTESNKVKPSDSSTIAPWLVVMPDASQIGGVGAVRFNLRRLALLNHASGAWRSIYDGLPQWRVQSNPDTTSGYQDVAPVREADGSYSFVLPPGKALHMAAGPWPTVLASDGVIAIAEGRLLGASVSVLRAKVGLAAGADWRGANGDFSRGMSTPGYHEAGFGHFRLLTGVFGASFMLTAAMTDDQVRASGLVE